MAVVMDLHRLGVDIGFEGIGRVRQGIKVERSGYGLRGGNTRHARDRCHCGRSENEVTSVGEHRVPPFFRR